MNTLDGVCIVGSLPEPIGGVSTLCVNLSRALVRLGIPVTVIDTAPGRRKARPVGVQVVPVPSISLAALGKNLLLLPAFSVYLLVRLLRFLPVLGSRGMIGQLSLGWCVYRAVRGKGIAAIHSFHALELSLTALLVARYLRKPLVVTVLGAEVTHMPILGRRLALVRYVLEHADLVTAISRFSAAAAQKIAPVQIPVVYCGVRPPARPTDVGLDRVREKYDIRGSLLLYVGWLDPRKGPMTLLQALPYLPLQQLTAVFAGPDHGERSRMEQYCAENGLIPYVRILGSVSSQDLDALYHLADIFVFPTVANTEGFGLSAAEAMAAGKPVVASRIAAIPEVVINQETGFLFSPGDPQDLASRVDCLLRDEHLRESMGRAAASSVRARFDWSKISREILGLYSRVAPQLQTGADRRRLNVGCGNSIQAGYINADVALLPGVDAVCDFAHIPYPFRDDVFGEIDLTNVLEHLPDTVGVMEELHRVSVGGGLVRIRVPYWNSIEMSTDPTHVAFFNERTFDFFDPGSPLCRNRPYYSTARFRVRRVDCWLYLRGYRLVTNRFLKRILLSLSHHLCNVVRLLQIDLEVVKSLRESGSDDPPASYDECWGT